MKILLAPTIELARTVDADITIEAEYGDFVVEGSLYTAAHHGSRSSNPAPCIDKNIPHVNREAIFLISHIDLDTLGGIFRAMGNYVCREEFDSFWNLAAFIDINGPHKISQANASKQDIERINAYWAWSQANRGPRRDNTVIHDAYEEVTKHLGAILEILFGNPRFLQAGIEFMNAESELEANSFYAMIHGRKPVVIVRQSDNFVNHLYTHDGTTADLVLAYNTKTKAITLSRESNDVLVNCCEIMQSVFGPTAGGHAGIAGTPRGVEYKLSDTNEVIAEIEKYNK